MLRRRGGFCRFSGWRWTVGSAERPTSYAELAGVLTALPMLLREARRARGLSIRAAASQIGCSFSTIHRIEHGEDAVMSNVSGVMRWLDQTVPATDPATHGLNHAPLPKGSLLAPGFCAGCDALRAHTHPPTDDPA